MIAEIAKALQAHRAGTNQWMARCPAHDDREPSLSIAVKNGVVLFHCHAGCEQRAVIAGLRRVGALPHTDLRQLAVPGTSDSSVDESDQHRRLERAMKLWTEASPPAGTLVEVYLRSRAIEHPLSAESIRFHPSMKHPDQSSWPCMVALMTRGVDAQPTGIHRTYLSRDGSGKAPVSRPKMMLGAAKGSCVRLSAVATKICVGEGIETCLSGAQLSRLPAWAALSTTGVKSLDLPPVVREAVILVDRGRPGEAAATAAATKWKAEDRTVRLAFPPPSHGDWNDALVARNPRTPGEAA